MRQAALDGASQDELVSAIRRAYMGISQNRAAVIAKTETNRAFTAAQYQADRQFLAQNDLTAVAFKKWVNRSDNPCQFCQAKAAELPIPFADIGDVLTATFDKPALPACASYPSPTRPSRPATCTRGATAYANSFSKGFDVKGDREDLSNVPEEVADYEFSTHPPEWQNMTRNKRGTNEDVNQRIEIRCPSR